MLINLFNDLIERLKLLITSSYEKAIDCCLKECEIKVSKR
jgi:hypothetical protein